MKTVALAGKLKVSQRQPALAKTLYLILILRLRGKYHQIFMD